MQKNQVNGIHSGIATEEEEAKEMVPDLGQGHATVDLGQGHVIENMLCQGHVIEDVAGQGRVTVITGHGVLKKHPTREGTVAPHLRHTKRKESMKPWI